MEDFLIKHVVGIVIGQFVIGLSAIVKLWFDFQTLKRDFDKKEKTDEKIQNKEEASLNGRIKTIEETITKGIEGLKSDVFESTVSLENRLNKQHEKIEMKIDINASSLEKFKEEIRIDTQAMRDSLTKVLLKQDMQNEKLQQLELTQIRFKLDTDRSNL